MKTANNQPIFKKKENRKTEKQVMLEPFASEFTPYLEYLNKTSNLIIKLIKLIPGSDILIRYVKSSHQNDPFRTFLELSLVFFIIRTWRQSRTRGDVGSGKSFVKLTEKVTPRHSFCPLYLIYQLTEITCFPFILQMTNNTSRKLTN
jgi:hypothetical protein